MATIDNIVSKSNRGGLREGAGRKKGSCTKKTRELAEKAIEAGMSPLEYLLEVMRDVSQDQKDRIDAAKSAAPYIHPKLSSVVVDGDMSLSGELSFKQIIVQGVSPKNE